MASCVKIENLHFSNSSLLFENGKFFCINLQEKTCKEKIFWNEKKRIDCIFIVESIVLGFLNFWMFKEAEMHSILVGIQCLGIAILAGELVYAKLHAPSSNQNYMSAFIACTFMVFVGYLIEMTATTVDVALIGKKISYLGKPAAILLPAFFVAKICKVKIPQGIKISLFLYSVIIILMAVTCNYHYLYYTSYALDTSGVVSKLKTTPGIFYHSFSVLTIGGILFTAGVLVRAFRHVKSSWEKDKLLLICFIPLVGILCKSVSMSGILGDFDISYAASLVSSLCLLLFFAKYSIFDVVALSKDAAFDEHPSGFVVLDKRDQVVLKNKMAMKLYPEIFERFGPDDIIKKLKSLSNQTFSLPSNKILRVIIYPIVKKGMERGNVIVLRNVTETQTYQHRLEVEVRNRTKEIKDLQRSVIMAFANVAAVRDVCPQDHVKNTSECVEVIAKSLKAHGDYAEILTDEYIANLKNAMPLHDIGKIAISDSILKKSSALTDAEVEIFKTHTQIGAKLLEENLAGLEDENFVRIAKEIAKYHHERWNGNGYFGMKGEEIPLSARIAAIADSFDYLIANPQFAKTMTQEEAVQKIQVLRGADFEPCVVDAFVREISTIWKS